MNTKKGFFLIEALLSIVIFSVLILSLFSMISFLQRRVTRSTFESDAASLLQDGMEIAHSSILSDWNGYPDGIYFPIFDNDSKTWVLMPGEEENLQTIFNRKIELKKVCRNTTTGEAVSYSGNCPGTFDTLSRKIITTVWWAEEGNDKEISAGLLVLNN